jgi:hypothetical protein
MLVDDATSVVEPAHYRIGQKPCHASTCGSPIVINVDAINPR